MITKPEGQTSPPPCRPAPGADNRRRASGLRTKRVRRLKISATVWVVGAAMITVLWIVNQWQTNGVFERFGHEGDPGEWNPTLSAVIVGISGLIVGIQALRVHFDGRAPIERLKLDVSSWLLGMLVITPLWALVEWQDNGAFERWSNNSQPGDWEPWFLYIGGIWAPSSRSGR
jgi:hypothetical protein